jgi:hypothetical protein
MALAVGAAMTPPVRFDALLVLADPRSIWKMTLTCLVFFLPFFLGAAAVGLAFARNPGDIGRLYCANLVGSGLGGLLALALMRAFMPETIPGLIAVLPVLAGIITSAPRCRLPAACLSLVPVAWAVWQPPGLVISEFKALSRALQMPGSMVVTSCSSPHGLMQVVVSPSFRFAPGVSLGYQDRIPATPVVFRNGDFFGPVTGLPEPGRAHILDFTTTGLPYALGGPGRVLVLDAGTGADAAHALSHGAEVCAVEQNPFAASMILEGLDRSPGLRVQVMSSRTFLMRDRSHWDLIVLPTVDAFGGTCGLHALAENHLLTEEGVGQMFERLSPGGMISVSCWLDYPPRSSLKLLATLAEAIRRSGLAPGRHIAAVRSWGMLSIAASRSPVSPEEAARVRGFCEDLGFDPVVLPGLEPSGRVPFNALQDAGWFDQVDAVISGQTLPNDFNIRPATDDRPYFSQFLTRRSLAGLSALYGTRSIPFFEVSYLVLIVTAIQVSVLAAALIILPLLTSGRKGGNLGILFYFGGIGIGYMFMEMVLIQRFVMYLGSHIYAAAAVISSMLFFSGGGSHVSSRLRPVPRLVLGIIPLLVLAAALVLPPLLSATIALPLAGRAAVMLLVIAPLAFCMGMPFALGISLIHEHDVPWAWGVNGSLSVAAAPLATILSVELGFTWVMVLAACAYGATFLAASLKKLELP